MNLFECRCTTCNITASVARSIAEWYIPVLNEEWTEKDAASGAPYSVENNGDCFGSYGLDIIFYNHIQWHVKKCHLTFFYMWHEIVVPELVLIPKMPLLGGLL